MTVYAWTPCSDGTIKKVDYTGVITSVDTGCTEQWIAVAYKLAVVPGRRGEVVSMNGLGEIKDRRFLQHRIAIAHGVENDVYCFDGRGRGTIVTLDNNGLITVGEKFTCPGIVDPMNCIRDSTTLYVACRNEDVYSFDTTTQTTTRISRNRDDVLTSVVDADTITKLRNNAIYARLFGGAVVSDVERFIGNGAIHTSTNRIIDSRIRADGVCVEVGQDDGSFVKSCPSRKSVQWIFGSNLAYEVDVGAEAGYAVFSSSDETSEEDPEGDERPPGTGVFDRLTTLYGTFDLTSTGVGSMCSYDEVYSDYVTLSALGGSGLYQVDYFVDMTNDRLLCPYMGGQIVVFGSPMQTPTSSPDTTNQMWLPDQGNIIPIGSEAMSRSASSTFYTQATNQFRFRLATDFAAVVTAHGRWFAYSLS